MLIDTDIFIDYLRDFPKAVDFFNAYKTSIEFSEATWMEMIVGFRNKDELKATKNYLRFFKKLPFSERLGQIASEILEANHLKDGIGITDAQIAATAIAREKELWTRNVKHYQSVSGLKLQKPY